MDNDDNDTDDEMRAAKATQQALATLASAYGADMCCAVFARWQDVPGAEGHKTLEHTEVTTFSHAFLEACEGMVSAYDMAVLRLMYSEIGNLIEGKPATPLTQERIEEYAKAISDHGTDVLQSKSTLN